MPPILWSPTIPIRFYAGAAIVSTEGYPLGTVCAIDREPRQLTPGQLQGLNSVASGWRVCSLSVARHLDRVRAVEQQLQFQAQSHYLMSFAVVDLDLKVFVDRQCATIHRQLSLLALLGA